MLVLGVLIGASLAMASPSRPSGAVPLTSPPVTVAPGGSGDDKAGSAGSTETHVRPRNARNGGGEPSGTDSGTGGGGSGGTASAGAGGTGGTGGTGGSGSGGSGGSGSTSSGGSGGGGGSGSGSTGGDGSGSTTGGGKDNNGKAMGQFDGKGNNG